MYDVFLASLRCPACGAVAAEAPIQAHLRGIATHGVALRVGCKLEPADLATDSIVESGYAFIREPEPNGTVQLLEVWTCLSCETEQWARVEITPGEVHA